MSRRDEDLTTARLLWAGCRTVPDEDAISELIADGADVDRAARVAVNQHVGPLLERALRPAEHIDRDTPSMKLLRLDADFRRVQAELLLPIAVARALEPLTAAGLEPLVFKGPTLAVRYPAPGLRPMDDIDVVLPPYQHDHALSVLGRAGWRPVKVKGLHHAEKMLLHPEVPGFPLELHRDLETWHDRANRLRGKDLWDQRVPISCVGVDGFGLPPEVDLVALAGHAGKPYHHFHRLIWAVDFALVAAHEGLDWDRVAAIARTTRCETVLAVALTYAVRLGAKVPHELLRLNVGRVRARALRPLLSEEWPLIDCEGSIRRQLRYALSDSPVRWVILLAGEAVGEDPRMAVRRGAPLIGRALRRAWRWRRAERDDDASDRSASP